MSLTGEHIKSGEANPQLRVGEVHTFSREEVVDRLGHVYTRRLVRVGDESDANPILRETYRMNGNQFEQVLRFNRGWESTVAGHGKIKIARNNEAARWLYLDESGNPTQMVEWAKRFPTAISLEPLQRLEKGGKWLPGGGLDPRTLELFTYMVDGIGLRSRARIYSERIVEHAKGAGQDSLRVISLGSGASVPNIAATKALEAEGVGADWRFYDFDAEALMFAQDLIEEEQFSRSTFDYGPTWINPETNTLEPKGQNYLRAFEVQDESVDVVDALGLWEYLQPKAAEKFAAKLYEKLRPGGLMIVSNMLPSRPQREFNQRAVGWPDLHLRNETQLLEIISKAGIDTRNVTMTHSEDGVYVVMEIQKP